MKARVLRYVVIPLIAVGGLTGGGVAEAETVDGVTVPNAVLTAGTGNQVVDITISPGSPVIGSEDQLAPSTEDGYAVGITAAGAGGVCTAFSSASWSCEPGGSGWRAGSIQLTISTAKATPCCGTLPLALQIIGAGSPVDVYGSIFINAAAPSAAPTHTPTAVASKPAPTRAATAPAATQTTKRAVQVASPGATTSHPVASASPSRSMAAAATATVSPSTMVTGGGAALATLGSSATDVADTRSSTSPLWILGGVAMVAVFLVGAFAGRRWWVSRQHE